ncbi:chloride channel protein [Nocardioides sp. SR21]|uniref:chloride channel protein n=1 Tax=Nocardioides sp. SR21 TaxID=2919501 RepID=UPI001FA968B6|nr:chloride channel protein [Nocardioides sp. SR21]
MARTLWLALVLGGAVGVVAGLYLEVVRLAQELLWEGTDPWVLPGDSWWQVIALCGVGGLAVGALRIRHDRDTPHDLEDALAELDDVVDEDRKPPVKVSYLTRAVLLGVVSLAFGASLGPEAPLIVLAAGLGDRVARILRTSRSEAALISASGALSGLFGGPLAAIALPLERGRDSDKKVRMIGASFVAGVAGLITMLLVLPESGTHYELPPIETGTARELLEAVGWSALAAVPAAIAGLLLLMSTEPAQRWATRLAPATVPRAVVGGLVLGVCGAIDGLTLFSGEHQGQDLIDSASDTAASALLVLVLLKLVATLACLSTGWFGGQIFPSVFMGMAAALALAEVWSAVPVGAAVAAGGAAAASAVLRRPLATVLILLLFFPLGALIPLAVGAGVGALAVSLLGDRAPEPHQLAAP